MSYLVMECHSGYAVLLDEEGRFVKAANLHYEVGQTVYEPVLLHSTPSRRAARWFTGGAAAIAACFLLVFGLRFYQNNMVPYSSIYLSINPEVQVDLNKINTVIKVTGRNADGETLVEGYTGKGKDKVTVANELIEKAIEMGFLTEGGRVSFAIDTPEESLFAEYGTELRSGLTKYADEHISIEIVDYNRQQIEQPPKPPAQTITLDPPKPTYNEQDYAVTPSVKPTESPSINTPAVTPSVQPTESPSVNPTAAPKDQVDTSTNNGVNDYRPQATDYDPNGDSSYDPDPSSNSNYDPDEDPKEDEEDNEDVNDEEEEDDD